MKKNNNNYIVTDSCYWHDNKKKRSTHFIEVCDLKTGEIRHLRNGTIVKIIKGKPEIPQNES